jgi:hypothetical protein
MPGLEVYPFKFRDPLTRKWVRARHKLQVPALQRRYADWRAGDTARSASKHRTV